MTWLSRLLPQTHSRQNRSAHLHRTTKQRRRLMTLESLEERVVLSDVSVIYSAGVLNITSNISSALPMFSNAFNISEAAATAGGAVTVSSASPITTINGFGSQIFVTPGPVTTINVTITGQSSSNSETVNLTGAGKTVPTTVNDVNFTVNTANLTLNVNNVDNSGPLNVTEYGKSGLKANIQDSHFTSMYITQPDDCCPSSVILYNTTVDGNVYVNLGDADGNLISVRNGSHLGSTTLMEGDGDNDTINVDTSYVQDLYATQGDGDNDILHVYAVQISATGNGVTTVQGDGKVDFTAIIAVTLDLSGPPSNDTRLFPIAALPSIHVTQGDGDHDYASVINSVVTGDISIDQGGGKVDQAYILGSSAGVIADLSSIGLGKILLNGNASITQGDGGQATIQNVNVNSVDVVQGNGWKVNSKVTDSVVNGSINVIQGDGSVDVPVTTPPTLPGYDTALVDKITATIVDPVKNVGSMTGGISVTQGTGAAGTGNYATATVSNANALGKVQITQKGGVGDTATILNVDPYNVVIIQLLAGDNATASITNAIATNAISILQGNGKNNQATVTNSKAITPGGVPSTLNAFNNIRIIQGNGTKDTATITGSRADGNFYITQGDGSLDTATIEDSTAGFVIPIAPGLVYDWQGDATITQGNGNGDVANFTGLKGANGQPGVNNIYANQGDNVFDEDNCAPGTYDEVHVNDSVVTSDIVIHQGDHDNDEFGNYYTTIADTGNVTAGGKTEIRQDATGNAVVLGSAATSFVTNYLGVNTGTGGSFVMVTNTTVVMGALFGPFTINASGPGNTYISGGGNAGVTVSPIFNS